MAQTSPDDGRALAGKLLLVAAVAALALALFALRQVLLLVFASILIAVALRGLAHAIERFTPLRGAWSMAAAGLVVLAAAVGLFWLLGAQVAAQVTELVRSLPAAWNELRADLAGNRFLAPLVTELESRSANQLSSAVARLGGFTLSFAGAALDTLIVLIAAVFMAISPREYREGFLALAPKPHRPRIGEALDASAKALRKWLLGTLVSMTFLAGAVTLGLWALGVPAPLALGLLAGLAQFVPLIGPIVAAVPGVLLALSAGPETALWTLALYFAASQVEANFVYPLIQKRAVSLPPALTLFAVIGMGLLFGPIGAVLATPLVVVASVFTVIFYVRGALGDREAQVPGQDEPEGSGRKAGARAR